MAPELLQLPVEILTAIPVYLPNRDIKSLRLSCRALLATSKLRLERVFLSANSRNIEVFKAIADHEVLRRQIVEIIWDDARLKDEPAPRRSGDPESPNFDPEFDPDFDEVEEIEVDYDDIDDGNDDDDDDSDSDDEECPPWFAIACRKNLQDIKNYTRNDVHWPDPIALAKLVAHISLTRSWQHYQNLLQQQREILAIDADAEAFEYGLQRFPALRRVTITPVAHGWLVSRPLYETPMIRAFPPSFNYPVPCGWPVERPTQRLWENTSESEKNTWRGFRLATRALAKQTLAKKTQKQKQGVTEIVIDVNQTLTGLNAHIFDEECAEQRDLVAVLCRPNFQRLDLALAVGGLEHYGWRAFRSGCLRRTLAAAPALTHVSLVTDLVDDPDPNYNGQPSGDHNFIPLHDIFPVNTWAHLSHFRLSRFLVRQGNLFSFLEALPATLRSLELSFLVFLDGNYRDLFADIRNLGWHDRPADERPRVAIGLHNPLHNPKRGVWADRLVEAFLYHDAPNPFGADGWTASRIPYGWGGLVKDSFDPAFERPWVLFGELQKLGYIRT